MLCIVVNHMFLFPSAWMFFTGKTQLWVSAAEGFFFLSGVMIGLVRGAEYRKAQSIIPVIKKLLQRAWVLYLVNIVVVVFSVLVARDLTQMNSLVNVKAGFPSYGTISGLILQASTLQLNYGWADFLQYYITFLILAIPAFWLIHKNMWYLVLGLAVLGWFEPQILDLGSFQKYYFYWQFYFFFGLIIGYYYHSLQGWFRSIDPRIQSMTRKFFVYIFISSVLINWLLVYISKPSMINKVPGFMRFFGEWAVLLHTASEPLVYADRTGILRPVVFVVWIVGMYFLFKRFEIFLKTRLDWLLGELGRQSLRAYIISSIVALILPALVVPKGFVVNTLVSAGIVIIILILTKNKFIQRLIPG